MLYRESYNLNIILKQPQGGRKKMFYFAPHLLEGKKKETEESWAPPAGPRIDWPKYWHHGVIPYFIDPKTYGEYNYQLFIFSL